MDGRGIVVRAGEHRSRRICLGAACFHTGGGGTVPDGHGAYGLAADPRRASARFPAPLLPLARLPLAPQARPASLVPLPRFLSQSPWSSDSALPVSLLRAHVLAAGLRLHLLSEAPR